MSLLMLQARPALGCQTAQPPFPRQPWWLDEVAQEQPANVLLGRPANDESRQVPQR
jgi:hypothetical protein